MKRKILCILLVCCLLLFAGCREPVPPLVNTTATESSITAVEPTAGTTETTTAATEPEETQATEAPIKQQRTEPTMATVQEVSTTEITQASTQPTDPPEVVVTAPLSTEPPTTLPATVPPETTSPATEPPVVEELSQLDCQEAMDIGNTHGAASYGWTVDPSLNESNAGFHFGSWVFPQDGQERLNAEAIGQVDFLYREMKRLYPELDLFGIRFRVHAFICSGGTYEVRVYYA